jgi:hypothetical protein
MSEHRIPLFRNSQTAPPLRHFREIGNLHAAEVFRVSCIVAVANYAIRGSLYVPRNMFYMRHKPLLLRGNAGACLRVVASPQSGDQQCSAVFDSWRLQMAQLYLLLGLIEIAVVAIVLALVGVIKFSGWDPEKDKIVLNVAIWFRAGGDLFCRLSGLWTKCCQQWVCGFQRLREVPCGDCC